MKRAVYFLTSLVIIMMSLPIGEAIAEETTFVYPDSQSTGVATVSSCACSTVAQTAPIQKCTCNTAATQAVRTCSCVPSDVATMSDASIESGVEVGSYEDEDQSELGIAFEGLEEDPQSVAWLELFGENILRAEESQYIRNLQSYLNIYRRCVGSLRASSNDELQLLVENGAYDDETQNAVSAFQKEQGLPITGEADNETKEKLFDILGALSLDGILMSDPDESSHG